MEPRYDINEVEARIERQWEESGLFDPDECIKKGITDPNAEPFSIVLPPPNVTGTLHMGHAAMLAIEDVMVRYARMQGKRTLWQFLAASGPAPIFYSSGRAPRASMGSRTRESRGLTAAAPARPAHP